MGLRSLQTNGINQRIRRFFRFGSRHFMMSIALLTFLLVKIIHPAIAQDYPIGLFSPKNLVISAINSKQDLGSNSLLSNKSSLKAPEAISLLEQGKIMFAAGRLKEAGNIWQQAVQLYEQQGNNLEKARSLNYLSLTYFNLGKWEDAQNAITQSLKLLTIATPVNKEITSLLAQSLNTQGNIQLALGQTQTALDTWQKSAIAYQSINDITGMLGSQINVAKALQSLGQYRRSRTILEQTLAQLQAQSDASVKSTGLGMLGVALQVLGDLNQSKELLEQSLIISQQLEKKSSVFTGNISETLLSLGNTLAALQQTDTALARYQQAATLAPTLLTRITAQINQLSLLIKTKRKNCSSNNTSCQKNKIAILALLPQIQSDIINLAPSRASIYAKVNLAASLMQLSAISNNNSNTTEIAQLVATAVQQAKILQDSRAEAYAMGQLGHLYEDSTQWKEAKKLTEQAIIIAQEINAPDITALLQWQQGRILKQQGKLKEAIAAYSSAVNILKSLRQELVTLTPDLQFSFTESVEPVYRELVALLLQFSPDQTNLRQARELIEALQLAELDNFFREACLKAKPQRIDEIDPKAAVIYPIVLPDRLAVIVAPPKQPLFYYETKLAKTELETVIEQLRLYLNPHFFDEDRLRLSKQMYDWLILPAETQLAQSKVETLVFVLDDALRSLPMAALYDGKQYLIQKYSIALTPGLQLLEPKAILPKKLKVLTAGLSESRQGFSALPSVENELKQIGSEVSASILLNQNFTLDKLRKQINETLFPIIHLATHGQFSSKAQETFLVAWDSLINVKDLNELLRERDKNLANPLELLVLSACQTATGDKKAALGLAGFAVRSGARSTLATLWQVNDESTANLMIEFYQQLAQKSGISKANALRTAQLELLKQPQYQHPFYWAPFVLVGNWL